MFKNYLTIALRNFKRHKGYSFINIAGLAAGMACSILILAAVRDERGTNRFHEKIDSLYLVRTTQHYGSDVRTGDGSVPALGPALKAEFPEVRNAARLNNGQQRLLRRPGRRGPRGRRPRRSRPRPGSGRRASRGRGGWPARGR